MGTKKATRTQCKAIVKNIFMTSAKLPNIHDDVTKWKHFPRYWPFVRGIHRSPGFNVFFDMRLNKRFRKQSWGWWFAMPTPSLWHHCYDSCINKDASVYEHTCICLYEFTYPYKHLCNRVVMHMQIMCFYRKSLQQCVIDDNRADKYFRRPKYTIRTHNGMQHSLSQLHERWILQM